MAMNKNAQDTTLFGNVVQEALVFSLTWPLLIPSARLAFGKPARMLHHN